MIDDLEIIATQIITNKFNKKKNLDFLVYPIKSSHF